MCVEEGSASNQQFFFALMVSIHSPPQEFFDVITSVFKIGC